MDQKQTTLFMIGNAHLDPVWLWNWEEGFQSVKATFRSALDRMNETQEFVFTSSSAATYEWIEENAPDMFEEIRARVREGRWHIAGGWWIQPDCNVPCGESLVRQGLYGQRYFREKLGAQAKVGYNVDSFGHNGNLPQILKKSGMDYYVFMRPMPGEKALPARLFRWESNDGSSVLAFRILFEYLSGPEEIDVHVRRCAGEAKDPSQGLMVFYGVGNHGGGPTKKNLQSIQALDADSSYPHLEFSDPLRYFRSVENRPGIPVVRDDLQHHASGCYAATSLIKQLNRRAENALVTAEKWSAAAMAYQPYPDYSRAWKELLFNQFHDILAGCCIESAYVDARDQIGGAIACAKRGRNNAVQALSWRIGIPLDENTLPIVVFNPNAWETLSHVEVEFPASHAQDAVLLDECGVRIPFQTTQPVASCDGRLRIVFPAQLPSLGYRTYRLCKNVPNRPSFPEQPSGEYTAENAWYRLELDPETGCIASLLDKETGAEVFGGPAAVPAVMHDDSDTWSHDVLRFQDRIGEFSAERVYRVETGPVRTILRVVSRYEEARMIQDFIVYPDKKQIDVRVKMDWRGGHRLVKLLFPVNAMFNRNTYEIPYGFIEREGNAEEEPMQNWVDVSGLVPGKGNGYTAGVALLNDGKYSASVAKNVLGLTVLRSPIYAHHMPYVPHDDLEYSYTDQGIQTFTYSILPHHGNWEDAGVVRAGWELNQQPITVLETFHDGELPQRASFLTCDCENVLVTAFKKAEDGSGRIVRAYETQNKPTQATIALGSSGSVTAQFSPCEIKTFLFPSDGSAPVEVNLIEDSVHAQ